MTREKLLPLIKMLLAAYPNHGITDIKSLVNAWDMTFAEDDDGDVYKAARLHMAKCKWFPKASEIKERLAVASALYTAPQRPQLPATPVDMENVKTGCDICPYGPLNGPMCLGWDKCTI